MKTISLLIGIPALLCSTVFGQGSSTTTTTTTTTTTSEATEVHEVYPFKLGYIGGRFLMTFSSIELRTIDDQAIETDFTVGFGGGGVIGVNLTRNFGLQAEVLYSSLAQKYKDRGFERKLNVSYLNIPFLFVLNTDVTLPVNLNVVAGPQLGVNLGSSIHTESGEGVDTVHAILALKKGDFGLAYGAGLDFMLSEYLKLNLGFRGVYGLIDVSDNTKNITTNDYYILHRSHVKTYSGYAGLTVMF